MGYSKMFKGNTYISSNHYLDDIKWIKHPVSLNWNEYDFVGLIFLCAVFVLK